MKKNIVSRPSHPEISCWGEMARNEHRLFSTKPIRAIPPLPYKSLELELLFTHLEKRPFFSIYAIIKNRLVSRMNTE